MVGMIASADGAAAVQGTSTALGNPADSTVLSAVRACADWIVAAAGTARSERYGLPRPGARARKLRVSAGRPERPRLAVASTSLRLPLDLPLFAEQRPGDDLPLILTGRDAPAEAVAGLLDRGIAEVVRLASPRPAPAEIVAELDARGAEVVLCEGGPSFNAQFVDAELVDELCLSIAPLLAGGGGPRIVRGSQQPIPQHLELYHLLEAQNTLFARYLVQHRPDSRRSARQGQATEP